METIFWNGAGGLVRVAIVAPLAYMALVFILRVSGKRMLSKLSAFDLVVTIALGSTLATIVISRDVALAEGLLALALLVGLQYMVAWSASRSKRMRAIIKSQPTLLFFNGEFIDHALREENVGEDSVRAAIRDSGHMSLRDVGAVVLEADGSLSVLGAKKSENASAFAGVASPGTDFKHVPARRRGR